MWVRTGQKVGSWFVLHAQPGKSHCRCDCGREQLVSNRNLRRGDSLRCRFCANSGERRGSVGKIRPEIRKYGTDIPPAKYRRLRKAATMAVSRCTNPDYVQCKDYGGRGISVCKEWMEDLGKFIEHLSSLPGSDNPNLYLDREDNNGNYEPGNLRFVTSLVSNHNKRPHTRRKGR